jgi:hypothetical protein
MAGGTIMALAFAITAVGAGAQLPGVPAEGPGVRPGAGGADGALRILRTVDVTLDRAAILGLDEAQVAGLEALRADLTPAVAGLREEMAARRDARREEMRTVRASREPLPVDPEARARVVRERRSEARARQAEVRRERREWRASVALVMDPLVQRYEQLVPPSQRPELLAGRRGAALRRDRGPGASATRGGEGWRGEGRRGPAARQGACTRSAPRGRAGPGG